MVVSLLNAEKMLVMRILFYHRVWNDVTYPERNKFVLVNLIPYSPQGSIESGGEDGRGVVIHVYPQGYFITNYDILNSHNGYETLSNKNCIQLANQLGFRGIDITQNFLQGYLPSKKDLTLKCNFERRLFLQKKSNTPVDF